MLVADDMSDKELALMAVAVYAMHRATAFYRHVSSPPPMGNKSEIFYKPHVNRQLVGTDPVSAS